MNISVLTISKISEFQPFGVWLIIDGFILLIVSRVCLKYVKLKQDKHTVDAGAVTEGEHESLYTEHENVPTKHA